MGKSIALFGTSADPPTIGHKKILGKLAAKEIFIRSKASFIEPATMIKDMTFNDPEIFNHINIYFSNRNLNNNFISILP